MIGRFAQCLRENILANGASAPRPAEAASGLSIGFGALLRLVRHFVARLFGRA
jgi:hypothetical protein